MKKFLHTCLCLTMIMMMVSLFAFAVPTVITDSEVGIEFGADSFVDNDSGSDGDGSGNDGSGDKEPDDVGPDIIEGVFNAAAYTYVSANGTETEGLVVTSYNGNETDIYIPSKIEGVPVLKIGDNFLKDNNGINSVTLGDGIKEIGADAFSGAQDMVCVLLNEDIEVIGTNAFSNMPIFNSIILWDSITSIGEGAFVNCPSLTIYCNGNSAAYTYALENGITYSIINESAEPEIYVIDSVTYYIMNGEAILMDAADDISGAFSIPSIVEGFPVTQINYSAFSGTNVGSVIVPDTVLSIGESAFSNCPSLSSVTIADSVRTIGKSAFSGCDVLSSVKLSASLTVIEDSMFYNCDSLTSITIPENVTKIGNSAFSWCHLLRAVYMGENVEYIGDSAFYYSDNLRDITLPQRLTYLGKSAFEHCSNIRSINIPDDLTYISECAFESCISLTSVTIPSHIKTLYRGAFGGCSSLKSVYIEDLTAWCNMKMESAANPLINGAALYLDNTLVTDLVIPEDVTEIVYAFDGCSSIKSVRFHGNLTSIYEYSFFNCKNIEKIYLNKEFSLDLTDFLLDRTSIKYFDVEDGSEFYSSDEKALYNADKTVLIKYAPNCFNTTFAVPNTVTEIKEWAFRNAVHLLSVTIPESVTLIGLGAFIDCTGLTEIKIPSSVVEIGSSAFYGCKNMTMIKIEGPITKLEDYIFGDCTLLTTVYLQDTIISIEDSAFYNCGVTDIYYAGSNADWLGVSIGTVNNNALIYATIHYGKLVLPESITLSNSEVTISRGDVYLLTATFNPSGTTDDVSWTTSNSSIARVSGNGEITGVGCGEAIITATTMNGGITAECSVTVVNPSGVDGNINWIIKNNVLELSGTGTMYTYSNEYNMAPWLKYKSQFSKVVINEGITSIGSFAFYQCTGLRTIVIPETVTTIESAAFYYCSSLTGVTLPSKLTAINGHTFFYCDSLGDIVIPKSVTSLSAYAFYHSGVKNVTINAKLTSLPNSAFSGSSLTSINLPDTLTSIGEKVFSSCDKLSSIEFPESLTSIGNSAFYFCRSLTRVSVPDSVRFIGDKAFSSCSRLTQVTLPKIVSSLGTNIFDGCSKLNHVTLPENISFIPDNMFSRCSSIAEVVVPESVTSIGVGAFSYCSKLERINIPKTLKTINSSAFSNCTLLKSIVLPDGLTTIGANAFANCTTIPIMIMPDSVVSIGSGVFDGDNQFVVCVYKDSTAHQYVVQNGIIHFVMQKTSNPEISYGTSISGTVGYTDGSVATGVNVEILYDDGTLKEAVTTDENGAYEFTYAEVGRYTVRVTDDKGNTASEVISVKRMNVFDVFVSGDTNLTLKKAYTVGGVVENAEDEATVTLTDEEGNIISSVETENGSFVIGNVPNGEYIIKAETENGLVSKEITVYNANLSDIVLEIPEATADAWGYVSVQERNGETNRRVWADVAIYDSEGVAVSQTKTDKEGKYEFSNLPLGEYTIVATVEEMRPDKIYGFDRNYQLSGYAYVNISESGKYEIDEIILCEPEDNDNLVEISGKVTAHGEGNKSKVILKNVFNFEVATCQTNNNGKFIFKNVRDGLYFLVAKTELDGMGLSVIVVRAGEVYGSTDITVYKSDKIHDLENEFMSDFASINEDNVHEFRERIAREKRTYDGLSKKEKNQLSKSYVESLEMLIEWLSDYQYVTDSGVELNQAALVVSGEELESESEITFTLSVTKQEEYIPSLDGVNTEDDFKHHKMKDAAGNREITQYYEISLTKTVDGVDQVITDVLKNTDATGKFRITMDIPEEYRGYRHYSVLHEHNGETVTLTDLDDNPDTITFEVDKFSKFALTATNEELSVTPDDELEEDDVTSPVVFHTSMQAYLNLESVVTMSVGYKFDDMENITPSEYLGNLGLLIWNASEITDETEATYENCDYIIEGARYNSVDARFETTTGGIAAKNLGDSLTFRAYYLNDDGSYSYSRLISNYSPKKYCYNQIRDNADNEKTVSLMAAILNYGAAAQTYFEYNTDNLMNSELSEELKMVVWDGTLVRSDYSVPNSKDFAYERASEVTSRGGYLNLEGAIDYNFYAKVNFTPENATIYYWTEETVNNLDKLTLENATSSEEMTWNAALGRYEGKYEGQPAKAMFSTIYALMVFGNAEGEEVYSGVIGYSPERYAYINQESDDNSTATLAKRLVIYGDAARTYFKD